MKPVISVIIPAYNEEAHLPRCLASFLRQKDAVPHEIIVADRNSTDRTPSIAKRFGARLIDEPRVGRAYGRNAGVRVARGTILAFTEADCMVPPAWIATIAILFKNNPDVIGVTGGIRFTRPVTLTERYGPKLFLVGNLLYTLLLGNTILRGTSFAVRKELFDALGLFSPRTSPFDDVDFGMRAAKTGRIIYTDALTVTTSPRRIQGRVMAYIREYISAYTKIFILHRRGNDGWFGSIRT